MAIIGSLAVAVTARTDDFTSKLDRAAAKTEEFKQKIASMRGTAGDVFGSWTQSLGSATGGMQQAGDKALGMQKAVGLLATGTGAAGGVLGQMSAALMGLPLPLGLAAAAVVGLKAAFDSAAESAAKAAAELRKVRESADAAIARQAEQARPDALASELERRRQELIDFRVERRKLEESGAPGAYSSEMTARHEALQAGVQQAMEQWQAAGVAAATAESERLRPSVDPVIAAAMRARESESLGAPGRQAQERAEADLEIAKAAAAQKEDNAKFDAKVAEQAEKSSQAMRDFAKSLEELNETPVEKFTKQVGHIIDVFNDPRSGLEAGVAGRAIQRALDDTGLLKQAKPGSVMELGSQMSIEAFRGGKETTESEKRAAEQVGLLEGILNELTGGLDVNIPDAE